VFRLKINVPVSLMDLRTKKCKNGRHTIEYLENDEYIGPYLENGWEWETWMRDDIKFTYKKGTDIIDIGGNIGCNALMFSDYGPVHTFEPLFHQVIENNLRNNDILHNVTVHKYGLSDRKEEVKIYLPKNRNGLYNYGGCSIKPTDDHDSNSYVNITLQKLDDVYDGVPSLMKIDVEGNEMEVIQGALRTIKTHKPALIVEIHDLEKSEIPSYLKSLGYKKIERLHSNYLFVNSSNHA